MITQLLNTAVSEGRDHTATNDEIWSKAKSFGFTEKLKDSDQSVLTTVIVYYLHGQKWTKKINAKRAVRRWTKRVLFSALLKRIHLWVRGLMTKLFCRSSFHLKPNEHLCKTPKQRRAEWERKWLCWRWASYLTCNLLIKRRLKSWLSCSQQSSLSLSLSLSIRPRANSTVKQQWGKTKLEKDTEAAE